MRLFRRASLLLFCAFLLLACPAPPPPAMPSPTPSAVPASPTPRPTATRPEEALAPIDPAKPIDLLDDGDLASLRQAVQESKTWYSLQLPGRIFTFGPRTVSAAQMKAAMQRIQEMLVDNPAPAVLSSRMFAEFDLFEATGGETGTCLFTGYYEPMIDAATKRSKAYQTPIYSGPDDTVAVKLGDFDVKLEGERIIGRVQGKRLVPYWKRAEIDAGRLGTHSKVLAYAKDPVDLFFVQVQGSATLQFPDGSQKRIGYEGSNGYTYKSIGKLLIEQGKVSRERMSMQAIRGYLTEHPEERQRILEYDESYVFFRWLDTAPVGVLGRPVTPGRSIATDTKLFPGGALVFLDTTRPVPAPFVPVIASNGAAVVSSGSGIAFAPLRRFVLNQDTGGAIKGAGRADFFWGRGNDAAFTAGLMKQPGRMIFLVPKP